MSLSRRTWLWTSTAALAAACARPEPTRLPEAGPEGPRPLSRRGAENLIALAELGAAIRWLHPSDQAQRGEWEPLLLDGVRALEGATGRAELAEGLRGLFAEVAPTVVIWRGGARAEDAELDEPACPDPEAKAEEDPAEAGGDEQGAGEEEPEERGRTKVEARGAEHRPPGRTKRGEPSDRKQSEAAEADEAPGPEPEAEAEAEEADEATETEGSADFDEKAEASEADSESPEADSEAPEADSEALEAPGADSEAFEAAETEAEADERGDTQEPEAEEADDEVEAEPAESEQAADADHEDRPPLPDALFAGDEDGLAIVQWRRRGYDDGLLDAPGCARRVELAVRTESVCEEPRQSRRGRGWDEGLTCATCPAPDQRPLAPAAPARIELPRGLASLVPLALWSRAGVTLPPSPNPELDPAPPFDEAAARDYSLADRGTRLLAVLRTWTLLRRFFPHRIADTRALLRPALCAAAEDPSPAALRASLETLLAGFGDGNGELIATTGRSARRYRPALALGWVEDRVVVTASAAEQARPGDVVTAIDGVSIDSLLAQARDRSPAASASAAIVRAVARLLERDEGEAIELELLRREHRARGEGEDERELVLRVLADRREDRPLEPVDPRPSKPFVELDDGRVYVDATRLSRLAGAARRLRRATTVIVDLRGELTDPRHSLLAHFLAEPLVIAFERVPTGPDVDGELPLEDVGELLVEPEGPRLDARVLVLADARTRGRAELELLGFDELGASIIGSASAGDPATVASAWLPGGWRLRFTHSELRRADGSELHGLGVRPTVPVEPTLASLRRGEDALLAAARKQ